MKNEYQSASELLAAGILRIAKLPPANHHPARNLVSYTVPLIAEDYPAKTAVMWNAVYRALGMPDRNAMMIADPKDAGVILDTFRHDAKYRGGGCGIGFKEIVLAHLDEVLPLAQAMGAVNIIKKDERGPGLASRLIGSNTDGLGYAMALEEKFRACGESLARRHVLILGAGGSAKAIAFALAEAEAELTILNRTEEKAHELTERINAHFGRHAASAGGREKIPHLLPEQDVVISTIDDPASPLDLYSTLGLMASVVSGGAIAENMRESAELFRRAKATLIVSDIRIRRQETAMLRQARELGFRTLDGIPMVINQGIEAFWWLYADTLGPQGQTKEKVAAIMRQAAAQS